MIDQQKSNNAPYQNTEQEWMKPLIKQYNLHEKNYFTYQKYYIYRQYQVIVHWLSKILSYHAKSNTMHANTTDAFLVGLTNGI